MKYEEVMPISRPTAEQIFLSGTPREICNAMLSIAYYDEDWKWAQDKCLFFLENENPMISSLAATCIGHIARIHGKLEKEKVIKILKNHLSDSEIGEYVKGALSDINIFLF